MVRKAVIKVRLVEKSCEKAPEEIEKIIMEELSESPPKIPYQEEIENVTVTEES